MTFIQKEILLPPFPRGMHLITDEVVAALPEIKGLQNGLLKVFIKHTSASLTVNENADPSVLVDFESHMNRLVPENQPYYTHTYEGSDDMPAHIKASLMGCSVELPISSGRLNLGTWQGLYLCEHRNRGGARKLVLSLMGQ